ncbi:hypothetical protein GCM10023094_09230 [Rhodococcus olei]|uniref:DUF1376 domain-containing protein n=1 Tax=Rhodococcus olei TaxID=2161675 RepID=A0ABP8NYC0_9NOCA
MPLTRADVKGLLTFIAMNDNRTVDDKTVDTWCMTLKSDLNAVLVLEAARLHFEDSTAWIMPAHVNRIAVQLRRDAADRESAAEREARQLANDQKNGLAGEFATVRALPSGQPASESARERAKQVVAGLHIAETPQQKAARIRAEWAVEQEQGLRRAVEPEHRFKRKGTQEIGDSRVSSHSETPGIESLGGLFSAVSVEISQPNQAA